jgi:hypothetical protein
MIALGGLVHEVLSTAVQTDSRKILWYKFY